MLLGGLFEELRVLDFSKVLVRIRLSSIQCITTFFVKKYEFRLIFDHIGKVGSWKYTNKT